MLRDTRELTGYAIAAKDGRIGHVSDFFFDKDDWVMRYLVVDTRKWLLREHALLATAIVEAVDSEQQEILMPVTKDQVHKSPDAENIMLISREAELQLMKYWNWAPYWTGTPMGPVVGNDAASAATTEEREMAEDTTESYLRSVKQVLDYKVLAENGELGNVAGFACDETWRIKYILVATRHWTPDRTVYVPREDVWDVSWARQQIELTNNVEDLRQAPTVAHDDVLDHFHQDTPTAFGVAAYQSE